MAKSRTAEPQESPAAQTSAASPRFSFRALMIFVLAGMTSVAIVAYAFFGMAIKNGQLFIVTSIAAVGLFLIAQFVRHRQRVSLRTLMIIISVLAVALAFVGRHVAVVRRETVAVQQIIDDGGSVRYTPRSQVEDDDGFFETEDGWYLPDWAKDWLGESFFAPVRSLTFGPNATDADLALLTEIREVQTLYVYRPGITAAGLAKMPLPNGVEFVAMYEHQLTEESAAHLAKLPELERILLTSYVQPGGATSPITEVDLRPLRHFQQLESLYLWMNGINSEMMRAVANLPRLTALEIHQPDMRRTIDVSGFAELGNSRSIQTISINIADLSDKQLQELTGIPTLQSVRIGSFPELTLGGVQAFMDAREDVKLDFTRPFPGLEEANDQPAGNLQ